MNLSITLQDVDDYIAQIRESGAMGKSERRVRLLEHLVKAEILKKGDKLKAYSIAIDIFERSDDFDPATDSIVRVEVGRLRTAIAIFEASEFAETAISVDIPVGTYRPVITRRHVLTPQVGTVDQTLPAKPSRPGWKVLVALLAAVALLPFGWFGVQEFSKGPTTNVITVQVKDLAGEGGAGREAGLMLRRVLSKNKSITVLATPQDGNLNRNAEFVLRGAIAGKSENRRANVELLNVGTGETIWATTVAIDNTAGFEKSIAETIGNELRVRLFGVSKAVLEGRNPENLTSEQLFIMATWVPGPATNAVAWEKERVELMQLALSKSPDFGAAHSVLADKMAYLSNIYGPFNTPDNLEQAAWHAQRALELAPLDPDVMFNVAQSQWHSGHIRESEHSMRRVLELDPSHDLARFLALVVPYTCERPPDDVVAQATLFDEGLSPDNPIRWLTLTWVAWLHLNRDEFELALDAEERAALIFQIPYTTMRRAVLLNKLGQPDRAADAIRSQKTNWPDINPRHFAEVTLPRLCSEASSGEALIENYVELVRSMEGRL